MVVDSRLRLSTASRLVISARDQPCWVVAAKGADAGRRERLTAAGVEVIDVDVGVDGRPDPAAVLAALGLTRSHFPFRHGAIHDLPAPVWLADSYHCSRYNTNTGRLTAEMFDAVFAALRTRLSGVAA